jgi:hypothetical protein
MAQHFQDPLTPRARDCTRANLVLSLVQKIHPGSALIAFPAKAGIHVSHGRQPSPVWRGLLVPA